MSGNDKRAGGLTLADRVRRISEIQAECEAVKAESIRLTQRLAQLEAVCRRPVAPVPRSPSIPVAPPPTAVLDNSEHLVEERRLSRRGALRALGGAAAGGVGLAIGSAVLGAEPAAAETADGGVTLGGSNDAGTSITSITSDTPANDVAFFVTNTGSQGYAVVGVGVAESAIDAFPGCAVVGDTNSGAPGVQGLSTSGPGVYGISAAPSGLFSAAVDPGVDYASSGIVGDCSDNPGVTGLSDLVGVLGLGMRGVYGLSNGPSGIQPIGTSIGVIGDSETGVGVCGLSGVYGVEAHGGLAPLFLAPAPAVGPPPANPMVAHNLGEIYIDSRGSIYGCTASSTGPPFTSGTWQRIAAAAPNYNNADAGSLGQAGSINLLPSPIRVFDSRVSGNPADPGRAAGALTAGSVTTLQITGVSQIGSTVTVPAGAVGVIGNVTAAGPAASGYLRLYPAGRPQPGTTNLDYVKGTTVGNFCVVGLSASGQMNVYVEATTNVVFDITGFVF